MYRFTMWCYFIPRRELCSLVLSDTLTTVDLIRVVLSLSTLPSIFPKFVHNNNERTGTFFRIKLHPLLFDVQYSIYSLDQRFVFSIAETIKLQ